MKFGVAAVLVACITPYGPGSILVTLQFFNLGDALGHDPANGKAPKLRQLHAPAEKMSC